MILIPAIDIIEGHCVRLTKGDYNAKKVYSENPIDMAKQYADCGVKRLHIVDLDGAKASAPCNLKVLEEIAKATSLDIEWGGGIKSEESLKAIFNSGANRAICGSVAVDHPELFAQWLQLFGSEHIILGADVRNRMVAIHGWLKDSTKSLDDLINEFIPMGLTQVICTDISKDGMLEGPNFQLYTDLLRTFPMVDVTLSGGISSIADLQKAKELGIHSSIIGKAIYEGRITLKNIEEWLQNE